MAAPPPVTSGTPSVQTPHPAKATKVDGTTPMEAQFGVEVARAAGQLDGEQANELVLHLLDRYEPAIDTAPPGSTYQQCHDATSGKPSPDYVRLGRELEEELDAMGIPLRERAPTQQSGRTASRS